MTLDEAIIHAEEVAEENEKFCYKKDGEGGYFNEDTDWNNTKCAAEHRQLAEWLKDYKRLLEQESCDTCEHSDEKDGSNCYECVKGIRDRYHPQPCEDAISRQAVLSMQYRIDDSATLSTRDVVNVDDIEDLPPVLPEPKTGYWKQISPAKIYECSVCGQNVMTNDISAYRYCHGCGAKMIEPQESEEV